MKNKTILMLSILVFTFRSAKAEVIVKYDFGTAYNLATLAPCIVADHISVSNFGYVGNGTASFSNRTGYGAYYEIYGGWPGSEYSNYFYFSVTIASGWSLNLDTRSIWFDARTTSMSGPNVGKVTYLTGAETILNDNLEIGGTSWYTYKTYMASAPTGLTGNVVFRIYGKDATTYGTFSVDNIILNGTLVALPPAEPIENIDPQNMDNQYASGENVGWINFEPGLEDAGTIVSREKVEGFIWAENIGWINLSPETYGGVFNDGLGHLSGYAWGKTLVGLILPPITAVYQLISTATFQVMPGVRISAGSILTAANCQIRA